MKFVIGVLVNWSVQAFIQDWMGKDRYIQTLTRTWVNTPVWIWPIFVIVLFLVYVNEWRKERGRILLAHLRGFEECAEMTRQTLGYTGVRHETHKPKCMGYLCTCKKKEEANERAH